MSTRKYEDLFCDLSQANDLYRDGKKTGWSDTDYDAQVGILKRMEESMHPAERKSSLLENPFQDDVDAEWFVPHGGISTVAMNSVDATEILTEFHDDLFVCSPKYDGLTVIAYYEDGSFVRATTGGRKGVVEDITKNFLANLGHTHATIPLKGRVALKGECLMSFQELERLPQYSSARSAASGVIRTKDNSNQGINLEYVVFDVIEKDVVISFTSTREKFEHYSDILFCFTTFSVLPSIVQTENFIAENSSKVVPDSVQTYFATHSHLSHPNFLLDGVVIIANSSTENVFKYKFVEKEHAVEILKIIHSVGRSRITPVALTTPYTASDGSVNTNTTLSNYVLWKNAGVGSIIVCTKRGAVISTVEKVRESCGQLTPPVACPSCNGAVVQKGDLHYCATAYAYGDCKDSIASRLVYFCSALGVKGLAFISAQELVEKLEIKNLKDFLLTDSNSFEMVLGENGRKIFEQLTELSNVDIHKFVKSLGIHSVGETASELLFTETFSFQELVGDEYGLFNYDLMMDINGVGEVMINNLKTFIEMQRETLSFMLERLKPKVPIIEKTGNGKIAGWGIVITGNYFELSRGEFKTLCLSHGAKMTSAVSGKTNLVVTGEGAGANKIRDAKAKGVQIMTTEEFKLFIGE